MAARRLISRSAAIRLHLAPRLWSATNDRISAFAAGTVSLVQELVAGPLFRFADWPDDRVPRRAAGVYTVWRADEFLYAGMSGRGAQRKDFTADSGGRLQAKGLWTRLNSHASGRRSGDQFNLHVCDRLSCLFS
jgi:hypothetical protein